MPSPAPFLSSVAPLRLAAGQSLLLAPAVGHSVTCLEVIDGVARVFCPCEETGGMTLAFLQAGDQLRCDRLCSDGVCVEALTPLRFCSDALPEPQPGFDAVK